MNVGRARAEGPIDWDAVRARLELLERETRAAIDPTREQAHALLESRARTLARVPVVPPDAAAVLTVITFAIGAEPYAIEARYARRVLRIDDASLTRIPGTPDVLAGVLNMEGEILPVFDLGRLFGLARGAPSGQARVVVLGDDRDELGLVADDVDEVRPLRIDAVLRPPGSLEGVGRDLLRGVTADALIVLDGALLLRDPRLFIDQGDESGP